jgi:chromosomal replication initiation ATPase DnaA
MDWIQHYKQVKQRIHMAAFQPKVKPEAEETNKDKWDKYNKVVNDYLSTFTPDPNSSGAIISGVAKRHSITVPEIKGASRKKHIVIARQEAMYLLRGKGLSFPVIAKLLGGRDHTTALHGYRAHKKRLAMQEQSEASQGG